MRKLSFIFLLMVLGLLSSCGAEKSKEAPVQASSGEIKEATAVYGYALRISAGIYDLKDGKAVYKEASFLGEKLEVLSAETQTAQIDGRDYNFVHVQRLGASEGWILNYNFAIGGTPAVVLNDESVLYKTPQNVAATGAVLNRAQFVVLRPETESGNFVQVCAYDADTKAYYGDEIEHIRFIRYLKTSDVSTADADVQTAILLHTARVAENETRKKALLQSALSDYPSSAFSGEIDELLNPPLAQKETQEVDLSLYIAEPDINVRDQPDEKNGNVIEVLQTGSSLSISEETVQEYTIGSKTAKWYHISSPLDGWVFGAFLSDTLPGLEIEED